MQDPVLERPMFQSAPQGQTAERAGLYAVAKATDDFSNQVQQAQDYEQLMNTIRGDNKTIEDRRSELAGIVGLLDAQKTPVSVLTVLQPAIELLQNKSSPGGIESLVADGEEPAPEAPMPEEPMRFARGGLVQRFADGGMAASVSEYDRMLQRRLGPERSIEDHISERERVLGGGDNSNLNANLALMGYGAKVASTPGNLITALAAPLPDFGKELGGIAEKKSDRNRAIRMSALEARDKDKDKRQTAGIDALKTAFTEYNATGRTRMQLDAASKENSLNRDLTRGEGAANRDLTRGEGSANRDLTRTENEANRDLTRGEGAANRDLTRGEGSANRDLTRGEGSANRELTRGEGSANRDLTRKENEANRDLTRGEGAANRGVTTSEGDANRQQQRDLQTGSQQFQREQTDAQIGTANERMYVHEGQIVRAKPSRNGWVKSDGSPLPDNAMELNDNTIRIMGVGKDEAKDIKNFRTPDGKTVGGIQRGSSVFGLDGKLLPPGSVLAEKADPSQPFNMVTVDNDSPLGLRQVIARTGNGGNMEISDNGGKDWRPVDGNQYYKGDLQDYAPSATEGGRTMYSPRVGPYAGKTLPVEPSGGGINVNKAPVPNQGGIGGAPAPGRQGSVTPDVGTALTSAKQALEKHSPDARQKFTLGAITGDGAEGRFVKVLDEPYVTYDRMSSDDRKNSLGQINHSQEFLKQSDDFLKAMPEAMGPMAQVKNFSTNVLAPFIPGDASKWEYLKTAAARRQLQEMRQSVRQATALNPRFPVGELAVLDDLIENPDKFFANPKAGMARLQETMRTVRNNMEFERARLENRAPLYLDRIPTATENDPLDATKVEYIKDLRKQGISTKGMFILDDKGNKVRLRD